MIRKQQSHCRLYIQPTVEAGMEAITLPKTIKLIEKKVVDHVVERLGLIRLGF